MLQGTASILARASLNPGFDLWNLDNDWLSFGFQTSRRISSESSFSLHLLLGAILLLITPLGALAAFQAFSAPRTGVIRRAMTGMIASHSGPVQLMFGGCLKLKATNTRSGTSV